MKLMYKYFISIFFLFVFVHVLRSTMILSFAYFVFARAKKMKRYLLGKRIILLAWKEHALFTSLTHLAFLYLRMRVQWRTAVNSKIRIQVFFVWRMHFLTNTEESNNATAWWHHLYLYLHSYAHFYGKHFDEWPNKYNED